VADWQGDWLLTSFMWVRILPRQLVERFEMYKNIICAVECRDCEYTIISDYEDISIYIMDGEIRSLVRCGSCGRVEHQQISFNDAMSLVLRGVPLSDFYNDRILRWSSND
jgi:hypothetical protein